MKIEPELNKWKNYICKTEWGCYKPVRINIMQRTKLEGSDKGCWKKWENASCNLSQ